MLGLRIADVRVGDRQLFIAEGKGGHHRVIPVADRFLRALGNYLHDERPAAAVTERLFVVLKGPRRGLPLSAEGLDEILSGARGRPGWITRLAMSWVVRAWPGCGRRAWRWRRSRPDPGQSGRSGAWTLADQPGLVQHPISASSLVRPSAAATDLISGATALGGIFSARAISFGVRSASRSSRTRSSNCCVGMRDTVPEPAALPLADTPGACQFAGGVAPGHSDECHPLPR